MIARRTFGVVLLLLALTTPRSYARAQGTPVVATATLSVLDARTRLPVPHARVLLDGEQIRIGFSDAAGAVRFEQLQPGDYEVRVALPGYETKTVPLSVPQANGEVTVIALTASRDLRRIGVVRARPVAQVDGAPAAAGFAGNTVEAVGLDAMRVPFETGIGGAALGRLTQDGAPLAPAGIAADPRGIDGELFASVRHSGAPSLDGSTQTIALGSINPTVAWQQHLSGAADSAGSSRYTASAQGTAGETGFAFAASARDIAGPLDGAAFDDGTGTARTHRQAAHRGGALAKVRAPWGAHTLTATVATSNARDDVVCDVYSGPVPCGYGPGLQNSLRSSSLVLADLWKPGRATIEATLFRSATSIFDDESSFLAAASPTPFTRSTRYGVDGAGVSAAFRSNDRFAFGGNVGIERDTYAAEQHSTVLDESIPASAARSTRAGVDASYVVNRAVTVTGVAGVARFGASGGSRTFVLLRGDFKPSRNDTIAFSTSTTAGSGVAFNANAARLTDPYHLTFDCTTGVARGQASGDAPGDGHLDDTRLTLHHRIFTGDLAVSLYRTRATGATIDVALPYAALADSLPFGYLGAATSAFATVGGCGSRVPPLTADGVVLDVPISGFQELVEGGTIGAAFRVHDLTVFAFDRVNVAKAYGNDPRIAAGSTFIAGAQLPGIPLHRAGLTLDYRAGPTAEFLLDARYVSANGPANLPRYVTAGAGFARTLPHGTLSIGISNLFDAVSGNFAHPGGMPTATRSGPMLATIARPLAPRRIELAYTIRGGAATDNSTVRPGDDADVFETVTINHPPLTAGSPRDALVAHTTDERCDARAFRRTRELLRTVEGFAQEVDAHRSGAEYPDAVALRAAADVKATYRRTATSYALIIQLPSQRDYEALSACADVRGGNADTASALRLFVPDEPLAPRQDVIYSPAGGLYVVPSLPRSVMTYEDLPLPARSPADPFALRKDCPSELRSETSSLLEELRAFTGSGARLTSWAATPVSGGYAFAVLDPAKEPAIARCGTIATVPEPAARTRGLSVVRAPHIGFASAYGLYVVRP